MTATQTLTHYRLANRSTARATSLVYATEASAREWQHRIDPDATVVRVTSCVAVGDQVEVRAYGRMRPGTVTKLGRSRVTVEFTRNSHGDKDERAFGATELRVPGGEVEADLDAPQLVATPSPELVAALQAERDEQATAALLARGTSAAAERKPTTTVAVPEPTPTTAQLQQLLPGQAFTYRGQQLRMVKVGKASFRAELADGSVGTIKARPTAVVEVADSTGVLSTREQADVVPMRPKADRQGRTARGRQVPQGKTGDPRTDRAAADLAPNATVAPQADDTTWLQAQQAKTLASKMDKPTAEGVAPGTLTDSGYLVRWTPTRHTALLVRKLNGQVEWLASCTEHAQTHPASSVGEADKLARGRATWCTGCQG